MESPARSRARRQPLPARARLARPSETDRRRPPNTAHAPDYEDAAARAPTPGPRGGGPGLAPDTPVTSGAVRHGFGCEPPDLGRCGTPVHGAGLAWSVRWIPPGAGGQQATRPGRVM